MKRIILQKFATPSDELTEKRSYEIDSSNIVETVSIFFTGFGAQPDMSSYPGWRVHYSNREAAFEVFKQFNQNTTETIYINGTMKKVAISEIGLEKPADGQITYYVSNFYFNSSDFPYADARWERQANGNYKIKESYGLTIGQNEIDWTYGPEYEFKGWTMYLTGEPVNMTVEEILNTELFPQFISTLDLHGYAWVDLKSTEPVETSINNIRLNSNKPNSLYIGKYEIIKVIYNGAILYEKAEKIDPTHENLSQFTYEFLSNFTHEQIENGELN